MKWAISVCALLLVTTGLLAQASGDTKPVPLLRSARSGPWSDPATWAGGKVPGAAARVQIRDGHRVVYDVSSDQAIRFIHVAGTLTFDPDKDTRLDVGLLKIQAGDDASEDGFECDTHVPNPDPKKPRPALEVGSPDRPIGTKHTALIRLVYFKGMDGQSCPAIVCCAGRMDFHGAEMHRTWVKLGAPARTGDTTIKLAEPVTGWKPGDRIILTATTRQNKSLKTFQPSVKDSTQTEERLIKSVDGDMLTLDRPLAFEHTAKDVYRAAVANLSRNVIVESADPQEARGHTMYHRHSAGSIGYAEFRHLGMPGVLGRYSLHYHQCGDTMRGSSVIGASVWDSGNRWLTIHGTNYLVVRDCVGYQSLGHGFFLEDGTEVFNVLDRNLAVQAYTAKPLPKQLLPFDHNDGAGFWWANSLNTFTRNVACDCDEYGYFFQVKKDKDFDPVLSVQQPDGSKKRVDVRTLPFVRFEDNETNCQRRHGFNLGGGVPFGEGVAGVGPDVRHPFVIRNFRSWNVHWAIHTVSPSVLIDNLDIHHANYGIWRPVYKDHAYKNVRLDAIAVQAEFSPQGVKPNESDFPRPLDIVDDLPPQTIITHVLVADGKMTVRGTTSDDGMVRRVLLNRQEARALRPDFAQWEIVLPQAPAVEAHAEDAAGNVEPRPHRVTIAMQPITKGATATIMLSRENASAFAKLALKGIRKEYPNKPGDVLNGDADVKSPRATHPAFYGCFDWHSSVHGHWMLVRLLRQFPDLPEGKEIRAVLAENLTTKNLQAEADYFKQPNRQSFERTYGWAWLLKLAEELLAWDDADAKEWSRNLQPLADTIVARYLAFLPKQTYPIRTGVHPNTAFGLAFALDYARAVEHKSLCERIEERARTYYAKDAGIPARWEPDGADFFSPSLQEADLMRRVLPPAEFRPWLAKFLPDLAKSEPKTLFEPATVTDRSDPQIVHLDGLNLSRAWCIRSIAAALPADDPTRKALAASAARHAEAALKHVASGDYAGEHWLASFAVYMLSTHEP